MFRAPSDGWTYGEHDSSLMHPPLMAIGDSIYNGMRSFTINETFAREAVPAQIARAIEPTKAFRHPRYPEALLIDVEAAMNRAGLLQFVLTLDETLSAAVANGRRWLDVYLGGVGDSAAWDNLALSGAGVRELLEVSDADHRRAAEGLRANLDAAGSIGDLLGPGKAGPLVDLHMAINGAFLINPLALPELSRMRPIDVVAARKPQRLLVHIGSNAGLVDLALSRDVDAALASLKALPDSMATLADALVRLPAETRRIYVSTLVAPSTIPNFAPVDYLKPNAPKVDATGYYPMYYRVVGELDRMGSVTGAQMRELDREVDSVIKAIEQRMRKVFADRGDGRLRFFRLADALRKYDGKHDERKKIRGRTTIEGHKTVGADLIEPDREYSNFPTRVDSVLFFRNFRGGGMASLDNLHPSSLGYSVFARELLDVIKAAEPELKPFPIPITDRADSLLKNFPVAWSRLLDALASVKTAGGSVSADGDATKKAERQASATFTDVCAGLIS